MQSPHWVRMNSPMREKIRNMKQCIQGMPQTAIAISRYIYVTNVSICMAQVIAAGALDHPLSRHPKLTQIMETILCRTAE